MSPAFIKGVNQYLSERPAAQEQEPQEPEGAGADTPAAEPARDIAVGELQGSGHGDIICAGQGWVLIS
jgi:hypothetical protein